MSTSKRTKTPKAKKTKAVLVADVAPQIQVAIEPVPISPDLYREIEYDEDPPETDLFDDEDIPVESLMAEPTRPDDGIDLSEDLTRDEKKLFRDLLNKSDPLEQRAERLIALSKMKGQKTAAVGLRAIQEINSLTGLSKTGVTEAAPMFMLPLDSKVSLAIGKVDK